MLLLPVLNPPPADVRNAALSADSPGSAPTGGSWSPPSMAPVLTPNSLSPGSGAAPAAARTSCSHILTVLILWQIFVITGRSLSPLFTAGSIFFARSTMPGAASLTGSSGSRKSLWTPSLTSLPFPQISFPGSGFLSFRGTGRHLPYPCSGSTGGAGHGSHDFEIGACFFMDYDVSVSCNHTRTRRYFMKNKPEPLKIAHFRFALIAPVIQGLYPDARKTKAFPGLSPLMPSMRSIAFARSFPASTAS